MSQTSPFHLKKTSVFEHCKGTLKTGSSSSSQLSKRMDPTEDGGLAEVPKCAKRSPNVPDRQLNLRWVSANMCLNHSQPTTIHLDICGAFKICTFVSKGIFERNRKWVKHFIYQKLYNQHMNIVSIYLPYIFHFSNWENWCNLSSHVDYVLFPFIGQFCLTVRSFWGLWTNQRKGTQTSVVMRNDKNLNKQAHCDKHAALLLADWLSFIYLFSGVWTPMLSQFCSVLMQAHFTVFVFVRATLDLTEKHGHLVPYWILWFLPVGFISNCSAPFKNMIAFVA